jgi:DnaD/phage-associated family protein
MSFNGFSREDLVGLPHELFTQVLPQISQPAELKVLLHLFYRLSRQRGTPRRLSWDELVADKTLQRSLRVVSKVRAYAEVLAEGLQLGVERRTLLHLLAPDAGRSVNWYLINTPANRAWVEQAALAQAALAPNLPATDERPGVVALYEQNIGIVTPLILEDLREAEERYPAAWIAEAMHEAVRANARSWRYVAKVLERWAVNGRQDAPDRAGRPIDVEKYTSGPYSGLFRRGSDTSDL